MFKHVLCAVSLGNLFAMMWMSLLGRIVAPWSIQGLSIGISFLIAVFTFLNAFPAEKRSG